MPSRDLPANVKSIVAEIETEIGEEDPASASTSALTPAAAIEGDGAAGAAMGAGNRRVEAAVRGILREIGEDPDREGLLGTPGRVHRMYAELTAGYHVDPERLINGAIYDVDYSEMVVVKEIPFYSLCEHHLLPFFGTAAVAYIPKGRVIGLSKIPRIVEMYARRLQVQERMTQEIAQSIQEIIDPLGVGVICEARHFCMMMRGVEKQHSGAMTSAMLGAFRDRKETRDEFLALVNHRGNQF